MEGDRCDQCRLGTFHLDPTNPKGCTKCFCFGATDRCRSSDKRRKEVRIARPGGACYPGGAALLACPCPWGPSFESGLGQFPALPRSLSPTVFLSYSPLSYQTQIQIQMCFIGMPGSISVAKVYKENQHTVHENIKVNNTRLVLSLIKTQKAYKNRIASLLLSCFSLVPC